MLYPRTLTAVLHFHLALFLHFICVFIVKKQNYVYLINVEIILGPHIPILTNYILYILYYILQNLKVHRPGVKHQTTVQRGNFVKKETTKKC